MRRTASVPARINIIGEHTDRFGGMALSFPSQHRLVLTATSATSGAGGESTVARLWNAAGGWDAELGILSEIPIGAGMSSSAALCVAVVMCAQGPNSEMAVSLDAQRIENEVLASDCGLLDQIAITHSRRGHASLIDFDDLSVTDFRIPPDWLFKLVDTGIRRKLGETNYNSPEVSTEEREMHALLETERVREALHCDVTRLGKLLNQSHASIRDNLRASTPAIDSLVKEVQDTPGVLGARLMGGGHGGMVLALLENEEALPGELLVPSESAVIEESI